MGSAVTPITRATACAPTAVISAPPGWQAAVANVERHGEYSNPDPLPPTMGLASIVGPREGTHQADYMNLWGGRDSSGRWHTGSVTLVSESWELRKDGNFHIEQWIHQLSPDGTNHRPMRLYLVETPGGRVLDSGSRRFTDEEAQANLQGLIGRWGAYQPPAGQAFGGFKGDAMADSRRVGKALRSIDPCIDPKLGLRAPAPFGGFRMRS